MTTLARAVDEFQTLPLPGQLLILGLVGVLLLAAVVLLLARRPLG